MRALDRATLNISTGKANDSHSEFFGAPMMKAFHLFEALQTQHPSIDVLFDQPCAFVLQTIRGRVTALETDRRVRATIGGRLYHCTSFTPIIID